MTPFDFRLPTRIVFGAGRVAELGELARSLGDANRVLVASDPGVVAAGHTQRGLDALSGAGFTTQLFQDFAENPTTDHVDAGVAVAHDFQPDLIIGLGGGSSMDCAKGINFLYSCGGSMQDYWGVEKATGPLQPMIAVPTTAGTGSETQSFALISGAETHVKMACGDKRAAFRIALLDPALTTTQPARVTALTGFDALAHAVETAVSKARTPLSHAFSREAWQHLAPNYLRVIAEPNDLEARGEMQLGACLAGLAIENSMLGAAHALANPLTAMYGIAHGDAVALMLPHVVRFNGPAAEEQYQALVLATAFHRNTPDPRAGSAGLAHFLAEAAEAAGLAARLRDQNVERDRLPELAADATKQWTGAFNPVEMQTQDFLRLYEQASRSILCTVVLIAAPAAAADWPLIRGNAAATGAVAEEIPHKLDVLWTYYAPGSGFETTPVIADGVVYLGDADGTYHAVKLDDGKPLWTRKFEDSGFVAGAAYFDKRVCCVDFNGIVRCLNSADGSTVWEFPTETSLYAAPNFYDGLVLIAAESGQLFGIDAASGKEKWKPFTIDQPLRCWPTVVNGFALVAGCDGKLHSVNVSTGQGEQELDIGGPADGMPAVLGNRVFFCTARGIFHAMNIKPLGKAWQYQRAGAQGETIHAAAVTEKFIVLGTHDKRIVALDPSTGDEKWTFTLRARAESSPVIVGDLAFFATIRGRMHVVDVNTGGLNVETGERREPTKVWEMDVGGRFTGSPAVSNGRIVIGNDDGTLYCIGAKK